MDAREDARQGYNVELDDVLAELAFVLGLLRMVTLLPLNDPALELVEARIASVYGRLQRLARGEACG